MKYTTTVALMLCFTVLSSPAYAQPTSTYLNNRYGYSITYPKTLLTPQAPSPNGDGIALHNKQGKERLRCWATLNSNADAMPNTIQQEYTIRAKEYTTNGATVTYKRCTATFFVLSGITEQGFNYYLKVIPIAEPNAYASVLFTYPNTEKKIWQPQIKPIGTSFK